MFCANHPNHRSTESRAGQFRVGWGSFLASSRDVVVAVVDTAATTDLDLDTLYTSIR